MRISDWSSDVCSSDLLDEEHRHVVADDVPVALLRVELDREAADVAGQVHRALVAGDGREAHERLGPLAGPLEDVGAGDVGQGFVRLEEAVRAEAASMHHALRNALMVEVEDLLAQVEVLQRGRPAMAALDQKSVVSGKGGSVRVDFGGRPTL